VAHNELKQHQQALRDYSAALSIDPKFALAHFNKGIIYLSIKQYHEAVQEYTQAIKL
jgi:tetratricopeptide (TPR) repeat protein